MTIFKDLEPPTALSNELPAGFVASFEHLGLPVALVESLKGMQITIPTPIQTATIPAALKGQDVLASAQTGTGKTVAYSIPLIMKLSLSRQSSALILTPTRELAVQVQQTLNRILGAAAFKTTLLIGGAPMFRQMAELKRRPQLIVGTPGRITDHLERGSLVLNETRFLIIDEADRMLDMGFGIQLEKIAEYLPQVRQTLMFSATLPPNIDRLSSKYLIDPQRITIGTAQEAAPKIKQEIIHLKAAEKLPELLKQLEQREGSIIIFAKTKRGAEHLCKRLQEHGHSADAIHGDLPQRGRDRVIREFRAGMIRVIVGTDVLARGLDIPHVMHVINYDLPQSPDDYIRRIGRTGRAGAEGNSLCLVAPEDDLKWRAIARLIDPQGANRDSRAPRPSRAPLGRPQKRPFRSAPQGRPRRYGS